MRDGKKCMRLKPAHYTDAKTPKQLINREKIRISAKFTSTCKRFINIGYQDVIKPMSHPSNEARSFILKNCFDSTGELPVLDYSKILISRGHLAAPVINSVITENGNLIINWEKPVKGDGTNGSDHVMIMFFIINGEDNYAIFKQDIAIRSDGTVSVRLPQSDKVVHAWMFFHNPNAATGESRKKISNSVYVNIP